MKKSIGGSTRGKTHFVEQCWVLIGMPDGKTGWRFRRRCKSSGGAASVEAAWNWALKREEQYGDVVGFYHTHPDGAGTQPSSRDIRTMQAWCSAFGKPLLCLVAAGKRLEGHVILDANAQLEPARSVSKLEKGWYMIRLNDTSRRKK